MSDEIRVGDRFLVEVKVRTIAKNGDIHVSMPIDALSNWAIPVPTDVLRTAKRLPRPLKVGDRVRDSLNPTEVLSIIAIDGPDAWVKGPPGRYTAGLKDLTPAEESTP